MSREVSAFFHDKRAARKAVQDLEAAGFPSADIRWEDNDRGGPEAGVMITLQAKGNLADRAVEILDNYNPLNVQHRVPYGVDEPVHEPPTVSPRPLHSQEIEAQHIGRHSDLHRDERDEATAIGGATLADSTYETVDTVDTDQDWKGSPQSNESGMDFQGRRFEPSQETQSGSVRPDEANSMSTGGVRTFESYDDGFRQHHQTTYTTFGHTYDMVVPAYRYGYEIAMHPHYKGHAWEEIQAEVQTGWEARNTGTPWEQFKDAVRHAWERVSGE